ncbi:MAG: LPS assembly lipoprotein LptE [Xenophilus sp.]
MAPSVSRRALLAGAAPVLLLAGCGFQLRRAPDYPFKSIAVTGPDPVASRLRRSLKGMGKLTVLDAKAPAQGAEVVCEVLEQSRGSGVAVSTTGGTVRELTLTLTVRFRLRTGGGKELIAATPVTQSRDISYDATTTLANESEQELLYRDMTTDIADQIVRRIGYVKAL